MSGPGIESAAWVTFPAVPGGVGELDADDIDLVADLADLVPDLPGDLYEPV
jgi:hypothetical protein